MVTFLEFVDVLNWNHVRLSDVEVSKQYNYYRQSYIVGFNTVESVKEVQY